MEKYLFLQCKAPVAITRLMWGIQNMAKGNVVAHRLAMYPLQVTLTIPNRTSRTSKRSKEPHQFDMIRSLCTVIGHICRRLFDIFHSNTKPKSIFVSPTMHLIWSYSPYEYVACVCEVKTTCKYHIPSVFHFKCMDWTHLRSVFIIQCIQIASSKRCTQVKLIHSS